MITSPGSIRILQTRSIACWPPLVARIASGSTVIPSASITRAIASRTSARPSVGPYCSALATESVATRLISSVKKPGAKVDVSGSPPENEITSSRAVSAIRSRIAEDFMTRVRSANSAE